MANEPVVHVIDDDDAARHALEFLIDCAGYEVRSYPSAVAFLKASDGIERGCIITDVRMPGMSGVELIGKLKGHGIDDPVIVITGHADVPLAIQAMKAGVSDFIEKPFSDDTILIAIRAALAQRNDRAEIQTMKDEVLRRMATLSDREAEVLEGLVDGKANKVIAYDLEISARTVEVYRANVMTKMHAGSLSQLVKMVTVARIA
jgi:two-component system response regulator FixJ